MTFSQTLLPEFEDEMKSTRKLLECIPDGKLAYRPHVKSMDLAQVATHVAEIPSWTGYVLDLEVLDLPADMKPHVAASREELLRMFDQGVASAREKIGSASDAHWQKMWTFQVGGHTIMTKPRSAVMRSEIMNHLVHHRAQLGVYLRLNDVAIPGMYGPSADEKAVAAGQAA